MAKSKPAAAAASGGSSGGGDQKQKQMGQQGSNQGKDTVLGRNNTKKMLLDGVICCVDARNSDGR